MKWVKRTCWLAAWGAWLWLGFGLYRELPRDLGPVIGQLTIGEGEYPIALIDSGKELATEVKRGEPPCEIRIYDLSTGSRVRTFTGPLDDGFLSFKTNSECGVVVSTRERRPDSRPNNESVHDRVSILDLGDGTWKDVDAPSDGECVFHPTRPWCLVRSAGAVVIISVVDLNERRVVFSWSDKNRPYQFSLKKVVPYFIGSDQVGIAFYSKDPEGPTKKKAPESIELWDVPQRSQSPKIVRLDRIGEPIVGSETGRLAWPGAGDGWDHRPEVFDVELDRIVFPKYSVRPPATLRQWGTPILSRNGSLVLFVANGGGPSSLFEVESGEVVWKRGPNDVWMGTHLEPMTLDENFAVGEKWTNPFDETKSIATISFRGILDGKTRYRAWDTHQSMLAAQSPNGPVALAYDIPSNEPARLRRLQYLVNSPLLALCQTILALPLVLVWAALMWRRKRRTRMASVAP